MLYLPALELMSMKLSAARRCVLSNPTSFKLFAQSFLFGLGLRQRKGLTRNRTTRLVLGLIAIAGLSCSQAFVPVAQAQTAARFNGTTSTLRSGFNGPYSVAVDGGGNVFVVDAYNNAVKEIVAGTGGAATGTVNSSSTVNIVGSGFNNPFGVAVDGSGNVFVSDYFHNAVKEIVAGTGGAATGTVNSSSTVNIVGSGFNGPIGVAVDRSGNVFVADCHNNAVKEIVAGTGGAGTGVVNSSSTVNTLGSGFNTPNGVSVDGSGNVFVADSGNSAVKEIVAGTGGAATGTVNGGSTVNTLGSGFNGPTGVSVDGSGNVFAADYLNNAVKEIVAGTGGAATGTVNSSSTVSTLGSGFSLPAGVAVDGSGNVFVADYSNNAVKEIQLGMVNFSSVAVATTVPPTLTLQFTFTGAGSIGAPVVLTQGTAGLDFADAGTGTCTAETTYNAGDTCTLNVSFTPTLSGFRSGVAQLTTSSGAVIATAYVSGTGSGPQVAYLPGVQSTVSSGLSGPFGVAADGSGNIYIADSQNGRILKGTLSGGAYTQTPLPVSNLSVPFGIVVDSSGNVYIADPNNEQVLKETLSGGAYTQSTVGSGLAGPFSVAVDASGNVYIADSYNSRVLKETPSGGGYTQSTIWSGPSFPQGIAVDGSGNVYIAEPNNNQVLKETLSGGVYTESTVGSGMSIPYGLSVDGAGNLYVADTGNSRVLKETLSGGVYTQSTIGSGFSYPYDVAVDGFGNVYVADTDNNQVVKVDIADPPALTFAPTAVGSTSSDSPQMITISNIGNMNLILAVPSAGGNPSIASGFTIGNGSCPRLTSASSPVTLPAGSSCNEVLSFTPVMAGAISGSLVATDNNLNVLGAMQSVPLSGTGIAVQVAQTITFPQPTTPVLNGAAPVTLTATATSGLPVTYTVVSGPATVTGGSTLTYTGAGTILVAADQAGSANYYPAPTVFDTIVVNAVASATNLSITSNGSAVSTVAPGSAVTLAASVLVGGVPLTSGQVNFCDASSTYCTDIHLLGTAQLTSAGTALLTLIPGPGSHSYEAVFAGTANGAISASSASTLTVTGLHPSSTALVLSGSAGNYTLTATVAGVGSTSALTGTVSFLDTTNANTVLATAPVGLGVAGLNFSNASTTATGSQPYGVLAKGDFNGDGKVDLAVPNYGDGTVTILLGNGDGTFTVSATVPTGSSPISVMVGDFNGDGKADLAVGDNNDSTVTILLGNGDGTFTAAASLQVGDQANAVVVGDFNGDGKADLAVANAADNTVTILLGNGDGTFTYASAPSTGNQPHAVAVGDFNGDGKPDLAIANIQDNTLTILLGNGDGTFTTAATPTTGTSPNFVAAGDFNADGKLDLAVTNGNDNTLTILLGNGDGTFTAAATPATGTVPLSVALGDFNGDGKLDLAVANVADTTVTILLGNGDGTFTAAANPVPVSQYSYQLVVADFNGDGTSDVAVTNANNNTASVLLSQLTQSATASVGSISPAGAGPHQVAASYAGDANYGVSNSSNVLITVAGKVTPALSVPTVSPTGAVFRTAVTLTETVQGVTGAATVTGTVTFYSGTTALGTAPIASGVATLTTYALPGGTNSITAQASGDTNYLAATSPAVSDVVLPVATQVTLTSSTSSITPNQNVTLTATVSSAVATPIGSAQFYDGTTLLGTGTLTGGIATLSTPLTSGSTNVVTAHYLGNASFASSQSSGTGLSIVVAPQDFGFAPGTGSTTSQTISFGAVATYNLSITPLYGSFPAAITFTITGLPAGATYTLSPSSIPAGSTGSPLVLTVQTSATASNSAARIGRTMTPMLLALLLLPLAGSRRMRKSGNRFSRYAIFGLFLLLSAGSVVGLSGCSSSSPAAPTAVTSTLTMNAISGSMSHAVTLTLIEQ
jgi:hypothetical protein